MGGGRRRNPGSSLGWYGLLLAIVLLGSGFVAFSRAEHLDEANPGSTPPLAPSADRSGDRWVEAVGFYTCDKFAPNLKPTDDPYGITTKDDGIILIAPTQKKYAGRDATLGLFAKGAGIELKRDSFKLPGDPTEYGSNTKCGQRDGKLVVREWEKGSDPSTGKTLEGNPQSILLKDKAAITVAWVPDDFEVNNIPIPPSAAGLEARAAQEAAAAQSEGSSSEAPQPVAPGAIPTAPGSGPGPAALPETQPQ